MLRTARTSAMKARTAVLAQISGVLTAAPEAIRAKYRGQSSQGRVRAMATTRPTGDPADPAVATAVTLRRMGLRHRYLSERSKMSTPSCKTSWPPTHPTCWRSTVCAPWSPRNCWSPSATTRAFRQRGRVRRPDRHCAGPGLLGQDHQAPALPWR